MAGNGFFDDRGIRFSYPDGWRIEVTDEGAVTTVALHALDGPSFALVQLDGDCTDPSEVAEGAMEAMREEYPALDATPANETIRGHAAVGHDVEFFSLDITSTCAIRCFRTDRRTVLLFGQWPDLEEEEALSALHAVRDSFEETDDGD